MRIICSFLIVLISLLGPRGLSAQTAWGVVARPDLDKRIARQLHELAGKHQAETRDFRSAGDARRHGAKLVIELQAEKPDSFWRDLKLEARNAPTEPTPELAREGYILEATYSNSSTPTSLRVRAPSPAGLHYALLRLPQVLRLWPAKLDRTLEPRAKSVRVESGARATLADYPSFPQRGVVEGFYGVPWSHQDRLDILRFEGQHGMNVYYYAPKDDPYHRTLWDKPYPAPEMKRLGDLVSAARENFVDFCFAISPGLSMVYSNDDDFRKLALKLSSVGKLGVSCFALFLDDVPQELENPQDRTRFKSLAAAHVYVINKLDGQLKQETRENRLVVTPTTYTNEWGSPDYIKDLGAGVNSDVDIVWTGTKVISPAVTAAQAKQWGEALRRPPLVWDNFPVNDGIAWRLNLGPMVGRDPNLPVAVRGLFSNPMNQARASMIPLETIADYLWNSLAYDPLQSYARTLEEQYGRGSTGELDAFLKTYGDYWWQENVFKPLFVEERGPMDLGAIERRLEQLDATLAALREHSLYSRLVSELSPFLSRTRERLAQVRADPAFRHLSEQRLEWRDDYDVLYAPRATQPPTLDGDFSKWAAGPVYALNRSPQIAQGAKRWKGPQEFSALVALAWDEQWLYVGVDVTDPGLYQPFTGRGIEKGDAFVLTLETAFRKNFLSTEAGTDEYRLLFSPGSFSGVEPSVFSDEDYLPPRPQPRDYNREIRMAWKKTPAGFSGDIAIPVAWFEGGAFRAGYEVGLSLGAQKVSAHVGAPEETEAERTVFSSKADRLFPARLENPSSYERLVLIDPGTKKEGGMK